MNYKKIAFVILLGLTAHNLFSGQGWETIILDSTFRKTKTIAYDNQNHKPFSGMINTYYKKFKVPTLQAVRLVVAIQSALANLQRDINKILVLEKQPLHIALGFDLIDMHQQIDPELIKKYPSQIIDQLQERCRYYQHNLVEVLEKYNVAKNLTEYYATPNVYALVKFGAEHATLYCFQLSS